MNHSPDPYISLPGVYSLNYFSLLALLPKAHAQTLLVSSLFLIIIIPVYLTIIKTTSKLYSDIFGYSLS